ncbi:hypothetical protein Cni_G07513 [Canna indica]|uniref:Uncharacterized protein n=1 Tax=Canna indica TaxID=4628 RepID=A0AAQ3K291_9LILI|nr:hypothetical protein Cni_G07513 [Canna indica]
MVVPARDWMMAGSDATGAVTLLFQPEEARLSRRDAITAVRSPYQERLYNERKDSREETKSACALRWSSCSSSSVFSPLGGDGTTSNRSVAFIPFFGGLEKSEIMGQCASAGRRRGERAAGKTGCLAVAKEHRSRFYIMRKCVVMLLCWNKYGKY